MANNLKMKIKLAVIAILLFVPTIVSAAPIMWIGDSEGQLGTVDLETGDVSIIGKMSEVMQDIAFDPNGDLWGVSYTSLYKINKETAELTLVGDLGIRGSSLVFDTDGVLYIAATTMLYTVDTTTGEASEVGFNGDVYVFPQDLAFIGDDLYLNSVRESSLMKVDKTDGTAKNIGNIGFAYVYGLASPNRTDLYGVAETEIITIDPEKEGYKGTLLMDYSGSGLGKGRGCAFENEAATQPNPPPSPSLLWIGDSEGQLGTVDLETGDVSIIGKMSEVMQDIAFDPSGDLWGVSFTSLYKINKETAELTLVGDLGIRGSSLVFDRDGALYASAGSSIISIDTTTGKATNLGFNGDAYRSPRDVAFIGDDLYISAARHGAVLLKADLSDKKISLVGHIQGAGNVGGLASPNRKDLYGVSYSKILIIDPESAEHTMLMDYSGAGLGEGRGCAFESEAAPQPSPQPSAPLLWIGDRKGRLGTVDLETGDVAVIGKMSEVMQDIAFDPNGDLWGVSYTSLYEIDKETADLTFVGDLGIRGSSLVFDSDGTLYAADTTMLYTVDTTTGEASEIGFGGDAYRSPRDLAFINDNLYLSAKKHGAVLLKVDVSDGETSLIGHFGGKGAVNGLASPNRKDLYGVSRTKILTINPESAEPTLLMKYRGSGLGKGKGCAFESEAAAPLPPREFTVE